MVIWKCLIHTQKVEFLKINCVIKVLFLSNNCSFTVMQTVAIYDFSNWKQEERQTKYVASNKEQYEEHTPTSCTAVKPHSWISKKICSTLKINLFIKPSSFVWCHRGTILALPSLAYMPIHVSQPNTKHCGSITCVTVSMCRIRFHHSL